MPKSVVVLSTRGSGFQSFVSDNCRNIPCFSASLTTVSSLWRPLGPLLIVVVPLPINWNHVPLSGTVRTSVTWLSWTIALMRWQRDRPLNAHVLTTEIPRLAMLARVASISASEFNTDNQYAFVPTNFNLLNYSVSGCWIQRWRSWAYFPLNENSPLSAVTNFPDGRGPLTLVLLVGVGFIADTTRAQNATSPTNEKNMGAAGQG